MAIAKQYLKSKPTCKVTFNFPANNAKTVKVSGDFNDWDTEEALELKKLKNGNFKGSINLPKDNTYKFRYLVDGEWMNDEAADRYEWNDFADAENGVIEV